MSIDKSVVVGFMRKKMRVTNYQKKITLIHDGAEDDLLKNDVRVACPSCHGIVYFGLYNSVDFDRYDHRKVLARSIRGLSSESGAENEYRYNNSSLRISENKCSHGMHKVLVVFTYKELQPARYQSYLVGVFDGENSD